MAGQTQMPDSGQAIRLDTKALQDDGTFEGYGSVFNNVDQGMDMVLKGAFRNCLKERGCEGIKMLFQHNSDEVMGIWTDIHEDSRGLYCKGKIAMQVPKAKDTYELMRMGAIDGLSIGYRALDYSWDKDDERLRYLKEVDVREVSVVTFPMNEAATVTGVKDSEGNLPTVRDFERFLRDGGLSAKEAKQVISAGYRSLLRDAGCDGNPDQAAGSELAGIIQEAARKMRQ